MLRNSAINFVLKVGLGATCIGFAIYSIFYPNIILDFYPQFALDLIGDLAMLIIGGIVALFMAGWIFSRKHKFACFSVFFLLILIAIFSNLSSLRFISVAWPLLVISFALMIRYYPRVRIIIPHKGGERMRIVPIVPDSNPNDKPATHDLSGSDAEDDIVEMEEEIEASNETKNGTSIAVETAPEILENDPAKTNEFLNNEKFVRGNKFLHDDTHLAAQHEEPMVNMMESSPTEDAIKPVKAKRAYKPRAKKLTPSASITIPDSVSRGATRRSRKQETDIDTGFSNSDSLDIHGNI